MMDFGQESGFKKNDGTEWRYNDEGVLEAFDPVPNCYE